MTFTVGPARPRPGKVRPRPGPQPAKILLTSPGPARACKFQARTRPGPQNIIQARPGPVHGLRASPARGPRPGPCRTLAPTFLIGQTLNNVSALFTALVQAILSMRPNPSQVTMDIVLAAMTVWGLTLDICQWKPNSVYYACNMQSSTLLKMWIHYCTLWLSSQTADRPRPTTTDCQQWFVETLFLMI